MCPPGCEGSGRQDRGVAQRLVFRISGPEKGSMELRPQLADDYTQPGMELRRHPRYQLEVEICVYPRNAEVVRGRTVDLSESGISAMLRVEVPVGEVVRLEFALPEGNVDVHAMVRQRNAFRYGFQFVDSSSAQEPIARSCRRLAIEQALNDPQSR